jgi:hypothetical protein
MPFKHTGIDGTLELFHRDWEPFREKVSELSGHPVPYYERVDQGGHSFKIDDRMLADVDTLLLLSLDHQLTNQSPTPEEVNALQKWLKRDGTRLILCPHHEVGASEDPEVREKEYRHHGDRLVGRQQRFGGFWRALMSALGIPVENRFGLNLDEPLIKRSLLHCPSQKTWTILAGFKASHHSTCIHIFHTLR